MLILSYFIISFYFFKFQITADTGIDTLAWGHSVVGPYSAREVFRYTRTLHMFAVDFVLFHRLLQHFQVL